MVKNTHVERNSLKIKFTNTKIVHQLWLHNIAQFD